MSNPLDGIAKLPPIVIDHDELLGIPVHKRVAYVMKKYLSDGNIVEKTKVLQYFAEALIGVVESISNPVVKNYLGVFRNGISMFELNTIFTNLIKVEKNGIEYITKEEAMKEVIKENFFHTPMIFTWNDDNDAIRLIIQNIAKTPASIADKYNLKILAKEEIKETYSSEAIIVCEMNGDKFAISYEEYEAITGVCSRNKEDYAVYMPWEDGEDNSVPYTRCLQIINILNKMSIEVFCHRINPSINYVTIDKEGYQIHTKKEVYETIFNLDYDDLTQSMEYCLEHNKKRGIAMVGDPGLGKGGTPNEKILTPTGWTTYGTVKIGDLVIGKNGKSTTVNGVFPRGVLPIYKVSFNDGSSIKVDGEHLWNIQTHNMRNRNQGWKTLQTNQLIGMLHQRINIPIVDPVETTFEKTSKISPYLMGAILGDGSISNDTVSITKSESELFEILTHELFDGIIMKNNPNPKCLCYSFINKDYKPYTKNLIKEELIKLGVFGKKSIDKFIPNEFLFGSIQDRINLLQGLMDTDGTVDKKTGCASYSTSSKQLYDDFVYLIESLGGICKTSIKHPKYTYKGIKKEGHVSYIIGVSLPANISPFRLSAKKSIYTVNEKYLPYRKITSIEPCGTSEVICISVEAEDKLYVTEHCIVTHNTICIHKLINHFKNVPTFIVRNEALLDVSSIRKVFNLVRDMKAILVFDDFDGLEVQDKGSITNEFLHQMDVSGEFKGIIIATINDPSKVHYTLISRPERFDEVILMRYPEKHEEIEEIILNKLKHISETDETSIALIDKFKTEWGTELYNKFIATCAENKFSPARISSTIDYCLSHFQKLSSELLIKSSEIAIGFQKTSKMFSENGELKHSNKAKLNARKSDWID